MHLEISTATNFVGKMLMGASARQKAAFEASLTKALQAHYDGHWNDARPQSGSAYRCLRCETGKSDPLLVSAATKAGVPVSRLPRVLTVWVDPGEVAARIGEKGTVFEIPLGGTAPAPVTAAAAATATTSSSSTAPSSPPTRSSSPPARRIAIVSPKSMRAQQQQREEERQRQFALSATRPHEFVPRAQPVQV
eukprot:m.14610 g.14610  ORF g.14610 m.14610 type:complete len:193 (+) comp4852_c0_seq1:333-911(+)